MKRVIAVSDSHGMTQSLQDAVAIAIRQGKIDVFVFLGDGLEDVEAVKPILLAHNPQLQWVAVRGNNDFGHDAPAMEEFTVCGCAFVATHGHLHHVKFSLNRLSYAARERDAAVALYGHTHASRLEEAYGVWMVNPGAICNTYSRGSAYAEILVDDNGVPRPRLYNWMGAPL